MLKRLAAVSLAALALPAGASAASFTWAPQTTDAWYGDFDYAKQTFAGLQADTLTFQGDGYFHNHGGIAQASIFATVNGAETLIFQGPIDETRLSDLGPISFAGGIVSAITVTSTQYVGNAFHSFYNESFSLDQVGPVGGVPEPAAWAMMILGFGVVGAAKRGRKAAVRFA